ncbi:hypothetical protein DLAC_04731 [Tieghemostelium lacteum]|uniref:Uncharacterized protein n=1 Tax=Tieghemostelium lacteum TaxID=361077 RepID=A0A151ZKD4_TIELA|nr:hypothetical protein DLAC_04731 [Tieghemostelium lacteum]|eukprot:KYQ94433.1 hypothetical protein DLAC_04731 [Tieghemostelium lacteum]
MLPNIIIVKILDFLINEITCHNISSGNVNFVYNIVKVIAFVSKSWKTSILPKITFPQTLVAEKGKIYNNLKSIRTLGANIRINAKISPLLSNYQFFQNSIVSVSDYKVRDFNQLISKSVLEEIELLVISTELYQRVFVETDTTPQFSKLKSVHMTFPQKDVPLQSMVETLNSMSNVIENVSIKHFLNEGTTPLNSILMIKSLQKLCLNDISLLYSAFVDVISNHSTLNEVRLTYVSFKSGGISTYTMLDNIVLALSNNTTITLLEFTNTFTTQLLSLELITKYLSTNKTLKHLVMNDYMAVDPTKTFEIRNDTLERIDQYRNAEIPLIKYWASTSSLKEFRVNLFDHLNSIEALRHHSSKIVKLTVDMMYLYNERLDPHIEILKMEIPTLKYLTLNWSYSCSPVTNEDFFTAIANNKNITSLQFENFYFVSATKLVESISQSLKHLTILSMNHLNVKAIEDHPTEQTKFFETIAKNPHLVSFKVHSYSEWYNSLSFDGYIDLISIVISKNNVLQHLYLPPYPKQDYTLVSNTLSNALEQNNNNLKSLHIFNQIPLHPLQKLLDKYYL